MNSLLPQEIQLQATASDSISSQYAAGFFDGEGCVELREVISNYRYLEVRVRVRMTNTNQEVLERIKARFGGWLSRIKPPTKNSKAPWTLTIGAREVETFLRAVAPYVIVKRAQLALALGYIEFKRLTRNPGGSKSSEVLEFEQLAVSKMRELNRRGVAAPVNGGG